MEQTNLEDVYLKVRELVSDPSESVTQAVTLDRERLDDEYMRISSDVAYWTQLAADAMEVELRTKVQVEQAKADVKEAEAKAYLRVQEEMADAKPKPTVATLEAHVQLDEGVKVARARLHALMDEHAEAAANRKRIDGIVSSIYTKREALISLGAHIRKEMDALHMST